MKKTIAIVISFIISLVFLSINSFAQNNGDFKFDNSLRKYVNIPVKFVNNLIIVPVSINNYPPINFLLDTGVKTTILSEPLLMDYLQADSSEDVVILGLGEEGYIIAEKLKDITLSLKGITGENMDMIVLPEGVISLSEYLGFPVYGIIGYDLFKQFPVRISYTHKSIRIYNKSNYRIPWWRTTEIPLKIINSKPYLNATIKSWDDKTDTVELLIDLGASSPLLLNEEYCDFSEKHISSYLGAGISGKLLGKEGRIKKFSISDIEIENPIVAYPEEDFLFPPEANIAKWDGIIGGGLLKKFTVIIDYSEELLVLKKNFKFKAPMHPNLSGIEVIAEGIGFNKFKVEYVSPGSPAEEADIRAGDYIISIDQLSTVHSSLDEVAAILNSSPNTRLKLKIQRDEEILTKQLVLKAGI
ncbi:MAG: PDZ domain-containing protein [Bacteroidota bacterium]